MIYNHEGHQIECKSQTPEDSKSIYLPVLPTMVGSMDRQRGRERACVHARACSCVLGKGGGGMEGSYFEGDYISTTLPLSYHYSAIPTFRELFTTHYRYMKHTFCPPFHIPILCLLHETEISR
jgi:hypothetical protein